jgi:hypothetical protein
MSLIYKYKDKEFDIEMLGIGTPAIKELFLSISKVNEEMNELNHRSIVLNHSLTSLHKELQKLLREEEGA